MHYTTGVLVTPGELPLQRLEGAAWHLFHLYSITTWLHRGPWEGNLKVHGLNMRQAMSIPIKIICMQSHYSNFALQTSIVKNPVALSQQLFYKVDDINRINKEQ